VFGIPIPIDDEVWAASGSRTFVSWGNHTSKAANVVVFSGKHVASLSWCLPVNILTEAFNAGVIISLVHDWASLVNADVDGNNYFISILKEEVSNFKDYYIDTGLSDV
jgi:hypothetical protein